jgi:hypothetical protein
MRLSFIFAVIAGGVSVIYRSFVKGNDGEAFGKNVIKTGGFLALIGLLGNITVLQSITDVINYMFVVIVLLNDGYDIIQALGAI